MEAVTHFDVRVWPGPSPYFFFHFPLFKRCRSVDAAMDCDTGKMLRRSRKIAFQNVGYKICGGGAVQPNILIPFMT